jgi:hypothetical protein
MGRNDRMVFQVWPDPNTSRPAAVERLTKMPVEKYWRTVRGDLFSLGVYGSMHADFIRGTKKIFPRARASCRFGWSRVARRNQKARDAGLHLLSTHAEVDSRREGALRLPGEKRVSKWLRSHKLPPRKTKQPRVKPAPFLVEYSNQCLGLSQGVNDDVF